MGGIDLSQVELGPVIGKGGQGIVYRARLGGQPVAIKIVVPTSATAASHIHARLERFARASEPRSVVAVLDHGTVGDAPARFGAQLTGVPREATYVVMAFVPYGTLADRSTPLSPREAVAAVWLVAEALAGLPLGVFHGDVRTANIALRGEGGVLLLDPDLTREPSAEDDLRGLGRIAAELSGEVPELQQIASELAGAAPLPKLSEMRTRLGALAAQVGATPGDLKALARPERTLSTPTIPVARKSKHWGRWTLIGAGTLLLVGFGPFIVMNSPLRPPPHGELVTNSDIVSTQDGLYDTTGTVQHRGVLYALKCGEKVDGRRGFVQITIAEPVKRVAILLDLGDGQVTNENQHALWELTDPPLHEMYCFDVADAKYIIEQDRLLADGQPQIDPKSFRINLHHPLRLKTTEQMMYAPVDGLAERESFFEWWWDGFE